MPLLQYTIRHYGELSFICRTEWVTPEKGASHTAHWVHMRVQEQESSHGKGFYFIWNFQKIENKIYVFMAARHRPVNCKMWGVVPQGLPELGLMEIITHASAWRLTIRRVNCLWTEVLWFGKETKGVELTVIAYTRTLHEPKCSEIEKKKFGN